MDVGFDEPVEILVYDHDSLKDDELAAVIFFFFFLFSLNIALSLK